VNNSTAIEFELPNTTWPGGIREFQREGGPNWAHWEIQAEKIKAESAALWATQRRRNGNRIEPMANRKRLRAVC
jgi:hypothetical protein